MNSLKEKAERKEVCCTPEKYLLCDKKDSCQVPKCPNCGKPLSEPIGKDKKIVHSICWHCGTAYYDEFDGFDER